MPCARTSTPPLADQRVWRPDALGFDRLPGRQRVGVDGRPAAIGDEDPTGRGTGGSRVANLLGSVAFGVSAVAAYVVPATDDVWNAELSNLGTLVGAICFLVGAILLMPRSSPSTTPVGRSAR